MTEAQSAVKERYDAVVIGAGSGGLTVAVGLSTLGKSVALVEADQIGGDCTNVGCIPSKSLLHHSREHLNQTSSSREVLSTVRARRDNLRETERHEFGEMDRIDLIFGRGKLSSATTVSITQKNQSSEFSKTITADNIIISTGARPRPVPIDGLPPERYLTNETFFEQPELPKNLVILGGGPIGLEMAVASLDLGSNVTVLEGARDLLGTLPPKIGKAVTDSLQEQGIVVKTDTTAKTFDPNTRSLTIGPIDGAATDSIDDVDAVLVAVGRVPNSDGLGLESVGVKTERGFVSTDRKGRTNIKSIWAVGDVTTRSRTTHGANAWGRRVIKAIAFPYMPTSSDPIIPTAIFTRPEVASIGDHPEKVTDDINRLELDLSTIDRAYTDEVSHGVMIVDVRRLSGTVLAVTIVGPRAGELIGVASLAMTAGLPLHKWYPTVWAYPTYSGAFGKIVDMYMSETLTNIKLESKRWFGGLARRWRT